MTRRPVTAEMVGMAACATGGLSLAAYSVSEFDGWAATQQSFAQLTAAAVVVGAAVVARKVYGFARTVGGHKIAVRTEPGHEMKVAAWHEAGHITLGKAGGGRILGAEIYPDGSGVTWVKMPASATVVDEIAVCVAGEVAARTSRGCGGDQANMRAALATLPPGERAAAQKAGYARASNVINGFFGDGGASSAAEKLLRNGRI